MLNSDLDILEALAVAEARDSFWAYRQYMHPGLLVGWWQREISHELQKFLEDLIAGNRPKLVIEAPPQHGKSETVVDFVTWAAGKYPDLRTIYTSFSERLGIRANLQCQRIFSSAKYKRVFPLTRINEKGTPVEVSGEATRNRELVEYVGERGYFRNTTVKGQINGEGLDLGVIDDPIKGREAANSITNRNAVWDWFTDDFFTRFSEKGGFIAVLTRWHIDDPIGRLRAKLGDAVRVVSYPAIAIKDEKHRKEGEALFPALKSLDFLLERKSVMASVNWEALYQQNPQIIGGNLVKGEWFGRYKQLPLLSYRNIYGDTAQKTAERNDFSVFECWGSGTDKKIYMTDLTRGKWEAPALKQRAKDFWKKHKALDAAFMGQLRNFKIEDKASGTGLIQELKTDQDSQIPVQGIPRNTDKYTRMLDVLGYIESGYVMLPEDAPWVNDFIAEVEAFSADGSHDFDDQVDPMMDAIEDMIATPSAAALWEQLG